VKGEVLQVVRGGSALYALVAPVPRGQDPSCSTAEPCSIERLPAPGLKLEKWLPQPPFTEGDFVSVAYDHKLLDQPSVTRWQDLDRGLHWGVI
jgi:hypothetical protein